MRVVDFIKNLIVGFWRNGFIALCKIVIANWLISLSVIILITYLCSDPQTEIYAWVLIGVFAVYSAIKAFAEIIVEIRNYIKSEVYGDKVVILQKIGGKIFEFLLCVVGIFQALRIFSHISRITKSTSSAVNVVDDVASAVSKTLTDIKK